MVTSGEKQGLIPKPESKSEFFTSLFSKLKRSHADSYSCCWCSIGVFFPIAGFGMFFTGLSVVLSHHTFSSGISSPRWEFTESGLQVGYILICTGLGSAVTGILVSVIYFTRKGHRRAKVGSAEIGQVPAVTVKSPAKDNKGNASIHKSLSPNRTTLKTKHKHFHRNKNGWLTPHAEHPTGKPLQLPLNKLR